MKYQNYFLQKNLSVGAILKKENVGFIEYEIVALVGEWAHIRSLYSDKMEVMPIEVLCDEYRYFYTRKQVRVAKEQ